MKQLLSVILAMLVLGAMVPGCDSTHRYDSRLTTADGLMHDHADSALALLEGLPLSDLTTAADTAYYRLLLTQSRYKAYITATSDSDINRALAYYRAHPKEREKLTRAYIYKGTVMEELGHPDSAMIYYKHAEANAAPDDYFNIGYCKIRIAELYQRQIPQYNDSLALLRLYDAKRIFLALKDTNYLIVTLGILGSINGLYSLDSAKLYLNEAIDLSRQFNPSLQYTYKSKLAGVFMQEGNYKRANELAMDILKNGKDDCYENQYYYYAALSFIRLGLIDSAKYVISCYPKSCESEDSMNYCNLLAEIAKSENDIHQYGKQIALSKDITTNIFLSKSDHQAIQTELNYNNIQLQVNQTTSNKLIRFLYVLAVILLVSLIITLVKSIRNIKNFKKEKRFLKKEFESILNELQISYENKKTNTVSELVSCRLSAIKELYQDIRYKIHDENKTKKVVPLTSVLNTMNERNELLEVKPSDSFWQKMRLSVNGEFNNIISFVENKYPILSDQDLKMFCLLCADITPQIIKLCMNFKNVRSVSNYRNKLIRSKMGLNMTFDEFVNAYMRGEID